MIWDMCTPLSGKLDEKKRRKIEELLQKSHGVGEVRFGGEEAE